MSSQHQRDVDEELSRIDGNLSAFERRIKGLQEQIDDLEARLDGRDERIDNLEADAELALAIAGRTEDVQADGGPTKKQRASRLSRDEVIRRTAVGVGKGAKDMKGGRGNEVGAVEVGDVQDMALPQLELKWQTVVDAWTELSREWECFDVDEDPKRLTVDTDHLSKDVVLVVERSLGREDLAKRLVDGYGELEG